MKLNNNGITCQIEILDLADRDIIALFFSDFVYRDIPYFSILIWNNDKCTQTSAERNQDWPI